MIKKIRYYILFILLLFAVGVGVFLWLRRTLPEKEKITIEEGKIVDLRSLAELCGMEIYRETIICDTIGRKVIYAVQKQQGRIVFDLEALPKNVKAALSPADSLASDTLQLYLPKERVEVYESVEPNSWRVVDTKSLNLFESSTISADEENQAKKRAIQRTQRRLYEDGTVKRARKEAAVTLQQLASEMTGRPVVIVESQAP